MEIWYLLMTGKFLFWTFRWWEIRSFLSKEVNGKMIFTGYWEVLVLKFSVMGNTVFFSAKKLMERWYLHGLFELSMIFQEMRNMVFRAVFSIGWLIYIIINVAFINNCFRFWVWIKYVKFCFILTFCFIFLSTK